MVVLKLWSAYPLGSPKPFHEVHKVKTIFLITLTIIYLFHYVDICTDATKAMVGKTPGALT